MLTRFSANTEADPTEHSHLALIVAAVEAMSPFSDVDASLASAAPFLAVAKPAFFCSRLRSGLVLSDWGYRRV
jgi:hypothetical protein